MSKAVQVSEPRFKELLEKENQLREITMAIERLREDKNKAVKKTLTIPEWLDEMAKEQDINFSQVLQEALKIKLGIHNL